MATILVVDDTDSGRGLMRQVLEESALDVVVLEAKDGAEALSIALSGDVDAEIGIHEGGSISLRTTDGDIGLRLPSTAKVRDLVPGGLLGERGLADA